MDNLRPVLQHANGEVMINFMYDFINRFVGFKSAANEESLDRCFGTRAWRSIRDAPDRESALVYATRSPKGIEKFRDVERRVVTEEETVRRKAQRENREHKSGQGEIPFMSDVPSRGLQDKRKQQLQRADAKVIALLEQGPIRFELLQARVLELPLVWKTDLNEILVGGSRSGRFLIEGLGPRERTPKPSCTIRLRPEKSS